MYGTGAKKKILNHFVYLIHEIKKAGIIAII